MKNGRWLFALFVLGILVGPLIDFALAGWKTSGHRTGAFVYDGPTPSIEDARRLINAYSHSSPPLWHSPWVVDKDFADIVLDSNCGYSKDDTDKLMLTIRYDDLITNVIARVRALEQVIFINEIEKNTTPFERGFLAECLNGVIYRGICKSASQKLFDDATERVSRALGPQARAIYRNVATSRCRVYDGVVARENGSTFLPRQ